MTSIYKYSAKFVSKKNNTGIKISTTQTLIRITKLISIGFNALDNFWCLSLIWTKLTVVTANTIGFCFSCTSYARWSHGCPCVGKCKIYIFGISLKIQVYSSLITNDQKHEMCFRNTFSAFQYSVETSLEQIWEVLDTISSFKILHFSVKTKYIDQRVYTGPSSMRFAWSNRNYHWKLRWNFRKASNVIECQRGSFVALNHMEN